MPFDQPEHRQSGASQNFANAQAFANEFDPPLKIVGTDCIDGRPVDDAYMVARIERLEDGSRAGFTCWFVDGNAKGYVEALRPGAEAAAVAEVFKNSVQRLNGRAA